MEEIEITDIEISLDKLKLLEAEYRQCIRDARQAEKEHKIELQKAIQMKEKYERLIQEFAEKNTLGE